MSSRPEFHLRHLPSQGGFTLIELIIAMLIAVFVLGAVGMQLSSHMKAAQFQLRHQKTVSAVRSALDLVAQDMKRAGYANTTSTAVLNAFSAPATFNLYTLTTPVTCVAFAYDRDDDGAMGADEQFGFAFRSADSTLVAYRGNAVDCTDLSDAKGWQAITDPAVVQITGFSASLEQPGTPVGAPADTPRGVCPFGIRITLQAQSVQPHGDGFAITQATSVKIRNDSTADYSGVTCNART
ncbi:prepilin-type N-terminal cleavage/methylation domain-containing protein [Chitinibacteraceae bacterium HSL-7]